MTTAANHEAQMLRRRALWFRRFGRLGAPEDRAIQDAVAERLDSDSAAQQQAREEPSDRLTSAGDDRRRA